jgi:hypothetical protein
MNLKRHVKYLHSFYYDAEPSGLKFHSANAMLQARITVNCHRRHWLDASYHASVKHIVNYFLYTSSKNYWQ